MDTKTRAARLLMHDAADRKIRGENFIKEAAQAKLYASEVSREVANEGIQIHGGYGYTKDFPAERFYRDAKLNEIYEGLVKCSPQYNRSAVARVNLYCAASRPICDALPAERPREGSDYPRSRRLSRPI